MCLEIEKKSGKGVISLEGGAPRKNDPEAKWKKMCFGKGDMIIHVKCFWKVKLDGAWPLGLAPSNYWLLDKSHFGDFPGGPVVQNLPSNAGHVGSIPGGETKIPCATERLSLQDTTREKPAHSNKRPRMTQWRSQVPELRQNK